MGAPTVPTPKGTRKKPFHFLTRFVPLQKPIQNKAYNPLMEQRNKRNNNYMKYLWSWRNRVYLQEYRVYKENSVPFVPPVPPPQKASKKHPQKGKDDMQ